MMTLLDDSFCAIPEADQLRLLELAPDLDGLGYFPADAFDVIRSNRHFHLFVPEELGGLDCSLEQGMRIIEAYSGIEGNLGWIVQIGAGGGVFSAYLSPPVSLHFFGRSDQVIAGSDYVGGHAKIMNDGYQVSGEWRYASGAGHATAFTANCMISNGPDKGKVMAVIVPAAEVEVIRDWNAMGLRATDSHTFRMEEVRVPVSHTFSLDPDRLRYKTRLQELPFLLYARALFMPVLMGIGSHYLSLYEGFISRRKHPDGSTPVEAYHYLAKILGKSRSDLYQNVQDVWDKEQVTGNKAESEFSQLCVRITDYLLKAIDGCHRHTGMEGIHLHSPINVAYRNIKTAAAHFLLSPSSL